MTITESFQTKILNPELTSSEEESLQAAARAMYSTYLAAGTPPLAADLAAELQALMLQDNSINKYVLYKVVWPYNAALYLSYYL